MGNFASCSYSFANLLFEANASLILFYQMKMIGNEMHKISLFFSRKMRTSALREALTNESKEVTFV
jgi:hypothetical protein